jgi:hypothetical protein
VQRSAPEQVTPDVARVKQTSVPTPSPRSGLHVGAVGDPLERAADVLADEMVASIRRTPSPAVGASFPEGSERIRRAVRRPEPSVARSTTGRIQRSAAGALQDPLAGGPLDDRTSGRIQAARSGGAPLPDALRSPMEQTLGQSLEDVRVHTGNEAASLSEAISARAFTTGNDVFFGAGEFRPSSPDGQHLIAHEVAHTVQQGPDVGRVVRREPSTDPDPSISVDIANFEVQVSIFSGQATLLSNLLTQLIGVSAAALGNPGMIGAAIALKSGPLALLGAVSSSASKLATTWSKLEGAASQHPAVGALKPLVDVIAHLPVQLLVWEALIKASGPGGPGPAAVVQGEVLTANAMILGLSPLAVNFARQGPSAPAKLPEPQQISAPPVGGSSAPVPVKAPEPAPVQASGGLVADALEEPKPNKVPKRYPLTKAVQPEYVLESTEGSHHLPDIFAMGERSVLRGRVPDLGTFMIQSFGWEQSDVDKYVTNKEKSVVSYLDADQAKTFELHDGAPMTQGPDDHHEIFDTSNMFSKHSGQGFAVYVMDPSGKMYANQHKVGLFHHSSFLAGGDVAGAGEIKVENGAVKWVTNKTGHYRAGEPELWQVLDELKGRGVSLGSVDVSTVSDPTARPGKATKFYQDFKPGA